MKKLTLNDFKFQFKEIQNRGYIRCDRKGDGSAGHLLEDLLGITENNESAPDIEGYELKVGREHTSSLQTLFNKEGEWQMKQIDFLMNHGFPHTVKIGEMSGQATIRKEPNKQGYYFKTDDNYLNVMVKDTVIVRWEWESLVSIFNNKFPNCLKVIAKMKKENNIEYFHFIRCYLCRGTNKYRFKELLERDLISVDFRLYTQFNLNKGIRNRGTAFRIRANEMNHLFDMEEI